MKVDLSKLYGDFDERLFQSLEKMLSYKAEQDTFDYIERRLAGLDYLYDHINIELLNKIINDFFKRNMLDDVGVIYDDINTDPSEPIPDDIAAAIHRSIKSHFPDNASQDDIIDETIDYIVEVLRGEIKEVKDELREHIDSSAVTTDDIREFIDKINIDINKITIILKSLADKYNDIEDDVVNVQNRITTLELLVYDLQSDNNRLQQSNNELSNRVNLLVGKNNELSNAVSSLESSNIELNKEIGRLKGDINNVNYNLSLVNKYNEQFKKDNEQFKKDIEQLKKSKGIDTTEYTKTLKQYKDKLSEFDKANKELYNLLVKYKEANEKLAKDNSSYANKINRINNKQRQRNNSSCWNTCDDGLTNWTRNVMYGKCC